MTSDAQRRQRIDRAIRWGALAVGVVLFSLTLYYINLRTAMGIVERLGIALPVALAFSGLWHLTRTWAWAWCFPRPRTIGFARLLRVRLAAEAFSYLTLRGIAGEPLKVVLLGGSVDARVATAAVALERMAYLVGTTVIIGIGSVLALTTLSLTPIWFRVFRAFAIVAAVIMCFTALIIAGRGTYVHSWLVRIDRLLGTSMAGGRIARFVSAVERQMLELVRGNPVRLAALLGATAVAYLCMALEAWAILRGAGVPISAVGALAVETFSRVASFASAFIPANLGALEASSLAAVSAIGAAGTAGAALAVARRLRGLFWAGIGLAIYPRRARRAPDDSALPHPPPGQRTALLYLPGDPAVVVPPSTRLAGLPIAERVLRAARRAGYGRIILWLPEACATLSSARDEALRLRRLAAALGGHIVIATNEDEWRAALSTLGADDPVTAIGAGTVVSTALLGDARDIPVAGDTARDVPAGPHWRISGVVRLTAAAASRPAALLATLAQRRAAARDLPSGTEVSEGAGRLALRIVGPTDLERAERTIRRASYKDTDATVAQFNRRMSLPVSIALLRTPLTANQLSVTLVALGFYSAWLFSTGHYWSGVIGAFLSLAASVLDGCDGEIARLKYQESALGCWIETFGDYSYYIAIFIGLTIGAVRSTGSETFYWAGGIALGGTLLTFALLIYLRT
ncbi:MAG: lysylphosphatidylglycerol synthase domain-containing protein, partial [Acidobacteriota bacterium]|nr:lysylphosphatidylglycerol synthase domain-containing protein [Acidobacteriota bacterium]